MESCRGLPPNDDVATSPRTCPAETVVRDVWPLKVDDEIQPAGDAGEYAAALVQLTAPTYETSAEQVGGPYVATSRDSDCHDGCVAVLLLNHEPTVTIGRGSERRGR